VVPRSSFATRRPLLTGWARNVHLFFAGGTLFSFFAPSSCGVPPLSSVFFPSGLESPTLVVPSGRQRCSLVGDLGPFVPWLVLAASGCWCFLGYLKHLSSAVQGFVRRACPMLADSLFFSARAFCVAHFPFFSLSCQPGFPPSCFLPILGTLSRLLIVSSPR